MNRGSARRRLGAASASLILLTLVGCGTIPGDGPVEVGLSDLEQGDQFVQLYPDGPVAGSSQEDIVRGFVQAAGSSTNDYEVAREFLAPDYASQWDPTSGVIIDDGTRPYHSDGKNAGALSLSATAKVDSDGVMLPVEPGPTTDVRFEFERVGDEWRISSAPSGIVLDSNTFTTIWSDYPLYFVGEDDTLVPETRWYLNRAALPTEIVSDLLAGPSEAMRSVVHSGFPAGTALVSNSVPVEQAVARVDVTSQMTEAGSDALAEARQQLKYSLQNVSGINDFHLSVEGSELRLPSESSGPKPLSGSNDATVLVDGKLGTFVAGEFAEIPDLAGVAELEPDAITLSNDHGTAAVRNASGVNRFSEEGVALVDDREGLLTPSLDAFDMIWTVPKGSPTKMLATGPDGTGIEIEVPWLSGTTPVSVRVSPDGSRIAALVAADKDHSQVLVGGVVRDADGTPTGVTGEAEAQLWASGAPLDLDWVGQQRFAVLTSAGGASKVTIGGPGQFATEQGSVPGGVQLAGGGRNLTQLRVLAKDGDLFVPQGRSGWQESENEVEILAKHE